MTKYEQGSLLAFRRKKDVKVMNNHNRIVQDDWTYIMLAVFQQMKAIREYLRIRRNYFTPFGKMFPYNKDVGHFHTHCYFCCVYYRQVFNELI